MIIDTIDNAELYAWIHPGFQRAFEFITEAAAKHLGPGRYEIDGDRLFALVSCPEGHGVDEAKLEVHRRYIDIQYTTSGLEIFGWKTLSTCKEESEPFRETDDLGFFSDEPDSWVAAPEGTFVVFFPDDAHAPLCGEGLIGKIVVKVAVESQPNA